MLIKELFGLYNAIHRSGFPCTLGVRVLLGHVLLGLALVKDGSLRHQNGTGWKGAQFHKAGHFHPPKTKEQRGSKFKS